MQRRMSLEVGNYRRATGQYSEKKAREEKIKKVNTQLVRTMEERFRLPWAWASEERADDAKDVGAACLLPALVVHTLPDQEAKWS